MNEHDCYHEGWRDGYYNRGIDLLRSTHDEHYAQGHDHGERDRALSLNQVPKCQHCGIPRAEHLMPGMCSADWALSQGFVPA